MLMRKSILNVIRGCILLLATVLMISCGKGDNALEEIIKGGSSGDIPEVIAKYEFSVTDLAETFDITEDITSIELTNDEGSVIATAELSEGKYTVDKSKLASVTSVWIKAIQGEGSDATIYIQRLTAADLTTLEAEKKLKMATSGNVIGADGKFYIDKTAAETATTTAEAMIAYIGKALAGGDGDAICKHGLAIAMEDANSGAKCNWTVATSTDADKPIPTWRTAHPIAFGEWRLPSADDWKYMFEGVGGDAYNATLTSGTDCNIGDFCIKLKYAGATGTGRADSNVRWGSYWSSTEYDADNAWKYVFEVDQFYNDSKILEMYVRACIAF